VIAPRPDDAKLARAALASCRAVVFDCDGVLVDSEAIANRVLAELISECGHAMTADESVRAFVGKTLHGIADAAERLSGLPIGPRVLTEFTPRILAAFERELRPTRGVVEFLDQLRVPVAVASNSRDDRLWGALRAAGLAERLSRHVYSAYGVASPKPAPDVYLAAAAGLGVAAEACVAFEDSDDGARAAVAARMTTIGYVGGTHARTDQRARLLDAGCIAVIAEWPVTGAR
jgi:HAD superfamily hydrolase (TIGR01509 family)